MVNSILFAILCLCQIILFFIARFVMTRCEGEKRISFISLVVVISLVVLGYMLEITSDMNSGGLTSLKVTFIGLLFITPVCLVFTTNYCEVKINKIIMGVLFVIPAILLALVWTTESHQLIYISLTYVIDAPVRYMIAVEGPLYFLVNLYPMCCAAASLAILLYRLVTWDKRYRMGLALLSAGICVPMIAQVLFMLNLNVYNINYTPVSMTIVSIFFYLGVSRFQLFDLLPHAKEIALQSIKEAFVLVDKDKRFVHANDAAEKLLSPLTSLKKGSLIEADEGWPFMLLPDENGEIITPVEFNTEEKNYYNANISPLLGDEEILQGYIIIIQDITESVVLTKKLEEFAYTDELTGIMNRRHFMILASSQYERAIRQHSDAFIILFDIDHFKKVNDTYGHHIGDRVLRCVSDRIKDTIRPYDLFGRYGGEEFILFVYDIDHENVKNFAERLRTAICGSPMTFGEVSLTVAASFGVASMSPKGGLEYAIRIADEALYRAKAEGRNRVEFVL